MASGTQQLEKLEKRLEDVRKKEAELARQKAALAAKLRARESTRRRKEETRRKIEGGGLLHIAGLLDQDPGLVLGGLLALQRSLADPTRTTEWKRSGDALLAERASSRRAEQK